MKVSGKYLVAASSVEKEVDEAFSEADRAEILKRAINPDDPSVCLTVHGEVLMMPGLLLQDPSATEHPEKDNELCSDVFKDETGHELIPYSGVNFITVPRDHIIAIVKAIEEVAQKYFPEDSDMSDPVRAVFGDECAFAHECIYDRLDMVTYDKPEYNSLTKFSAGNYARHASRFKGVNNEGGHKTGDKSIITIG